MGHGLRERPWGWDRRYFKLDPCIATRISPDESGIRNQYPAWAGGFRVLLYGGPSESSAQQGGTIRASGAGTQGGWSRLHHARKSRRGWWTLHTVTWGESARDRSNPDSKSSAQQAQGETATALLVQGCATYGRPRHSRAHGWGYQLGLGAGGNKAAETDVANEPPVP